MTDRTSTVFEEWSETPFGSGDLEDDYQSQDFEDESVVVEPISAHLGAFAHTNKDSMTNYLKEIGRFGLLGLKAELALARAAQAGDDTARNSRTCAWL